jgi:hypothetical protein
MLCVFGVHFVGIPINLVLNDESHGTAGVRIFTNLLEKPEQRNFNDLLLFENVLFFI